MASGGGDWKDMYNAAERGDVACVRYHLSAGVDVDYQHPEVMQTALVASLLQGHAEVARLLLEHGADPNLPAELGSLSPLQAAQSCGDAELLPLLQAYGAVARPAPAPVWWQRWLPL